MRVTTDAALTIPGSISDARALDDAERGESRRSVFCIPTDPSGRELAYFLGNSLGLMPVGARDAVEHEMDRWAALGAKGHFNAEAGGVPWAEFHRELRAPMARLVGARPEEVVLMNALTINLHLMLASFYRPTGKRRLLLREAPAFPSDCYAIDSQVALRGLDPRECVVTVGPREGETLIREEDIIGAIERYGDELALVLWSGLNYSTGQRFDIERITKAAHSVGAMAGFDLAHSVGNTPHALHDWSADFAAWCTYKYVNGGPGSTGAVFVHEKHWKDDAEHMPRPMPRLAGWWGVDPAVRFVMAPTFDPAAGAEAWQVSTPSILTTAPLKASLEILDEVGLDALRARSLTLTGRLRALIEGRCGDRVRVLTPSESAAHGAQLSLVLPNCDRSALGALEERGIIADFREPNIIRVAPAPLYSTNEDCWRLVDALDAIA